MPEKEKSVGRIATIFENLIYENLSTTTLALHNTEHGYSPSLMRARSPISPSGFNNDYEALRSPQEDQRRLLSARSYSSLNSSTPRQEFESNTTSSFRSPREIQRRLVSAPSYSSLNCSSSRQEFESNNTSSFRSPTEDQRRLVSTPSYSSLNYRTPTQEVEFNTTSSLRSFESVSAATSNQAETIPPKPINEIRLSRLFTMPNITPTPSPSPLAAASVFANIDAVRPYSVDEVKALFGPLGPPPTIPPRTGTPERLLRGKQLIERLREARRMELTIEQLNRQKPDEEDEKRFAEKYRGSRDLSKNLDVQKYLDELELGSEAGDESMIEESRSHHSIANPENSESAHLSLANGDIGEVEPFIAEDSNADTSFDNDVVSGEVAGPAKYQQSGKDGLGLGINVYDHHGKDDEDNELGDIMEEEEDFEVKEVSTPDVQFLAPKPNRPSLALRNPSVTESLTPKPLSCTPPGHKSNLNPDGSPNYDYSPFIKPGDSTDSIIDELLEENYRGQAHVFARKSSAKSIRSITSPGQSTPSSIRTRSIRTPNPAVVGLGLRSASTPEYYTPTRQPGKVETLASNQRRLPRTISEGSRIGQVILETYKTVNGGDFGTKETGISQRAVASASPHTTYGHRVSVPGANSILSVPKTRPGPDILDRGFYYFTEEEREAITTVVLENYRQCTEHENCTECLQLEYAYYENKAMPTSIPPEERQKIINNNRSLRNIKNELENLAEHGAISDEAYDNIMRSLPAESSLNSSRSQAPAPSPSPVPSAALNNLSLNNNDAPPPAYNNPGQPALPGRKESAPPTKPELARAIALYRYAEPGDCNFEVGDQISVFEFMNNDWWLGKNLRTNQEGVFPTNYVQRQANPSPHNGGYGNEKAGGYPGMGQQFQGPPPPGPSNPYNSAVPPMAVAEQPSEGKTGKGGEMGKKFGKKLGNAAIFGAGATIGGNIVNSIF